jgi:hypothetical protein
MGYEWLRWFIASSSMKMLGFKPRPVHLGYVVDKVALEQSFSPGLQFSPVNIITFMLHSQKLKKEYLRRLRLVLDTELCAKNEIQAIGALAVPVLRYGFGIINWRQEEL